jgi:nucleoside-diphosphate-sugar epimerase
MARNFASRGYHVRALVRDRSRAAPMLETDGIELAEGDIRDDAALAVASEGIDVVYHIAATYRQAGIADAVYREINAIAPAKVVEAAAAAGVARVVHCSTVGVHGDIENPPANEEAPFRPGDVYQATKLEGEQAAREAGARTGVQVTIARPSGIYGPGDRRLLKLFRGVVRKRWVTLGSGEIHYHLTYIDDIVEGFRLCGEAAAAANGTFIIAGPEAPTLNELVATIAQVAGVQMPRLRLPVWPFLAAGAACEAICVPLGIEPPIYRRRVEFFTKSRSFDISRARQVLGYEPTVGVREGVARTLEWYRQHGWV